MFLLVWIPILKRTDWDLRPAGPGIYEKGPFLDVTWLQVATPPHVAFILPSAPPLHIGAVGVCDMSGKTWPARARAEERLSEKHNHCSPLVFTRIEFPFSKATWGFSCVFAPIVLILVSLCLLLFRDPLFHADVIDSFDQRSGKNVGW